MARVQVGGGSGDGGWCEICEGVDDTQVVTHRLLGGGGVDVGCSLLSQQPCWSTEARLAGFSCGGPSMVLAVLAVAALVAAVP